MSQDERPLSELISSIEQQDFTPTEEMKSMENMGGAEGEPKEKKSKAFLIVVLILLLLIIGVGGYYVYDNYIDKDEVEEEEEVLNPEEYTQEYDEVSIDLGEGKVLYVKAPTSECDDTGYVLQEQDNPDLLKYEDNQNKFCSSSHILTYFTNEEAMTSYFSDNKTTYPLEKETINSIEYEYILKEDSTSADTLAGGYVYQKKPTVKVHDLGAFYIISYYKIAQEGNTEVIKGNYPSDDSVYTNFTKYCVFPIYQFGEQYEGFLVFYGSASVGSEIDYCEVLNNSEDFKLELQ